jgi:uncharacterized membrane protein
VRRGAERASRPQRAFRGLFGTLVAAQVGYAYLPEQRRVAATRAIVVLMLATATTEAVAARGPRRGAGLVASAGLLGFGAELLGVATGRPFGHYTYSDKLGPRVGGVPVAAAAAWAMMARPSWVVAGMACGGRRPRRAQRVTGMAGGGGWPRRALRVAVAAGALTAWDVFLDPRMAREGYWSWPGGGRYEGIPASNFAGWLVTGAGVFAAWAVLDGDEDGAGGASARRDDGALALYLWTWVAEMFANLVIWRRPRVAMAGGIAMGAFALPALRARLRGGR